MKTQKEKNFKDQQEEEKKKKLWQTISLGYSQRTYLSLSISLPLRIIFICYPAQCWEMKDYFGQPAWELLSTTATTAATAAKSY
jgi:hypothetical protein